MSSPEIRPVHSELTLSETLKDARFEVVKIQSDEYPHAIGIGYTLVEGTIWLPDFFQEDPISIPMNGKKDALTHIYIKTSEPTSEHEDLKNVYLIKHRKAKNSSEFKEKKVVFRNSNAYAYGIYPSQMEIPLEDPWLNETFIGIDKTFSIPLNDQETGRIEQVVLTSGLFYGEEHIKNPTLLNMLAQKPHTTYVVDLYQKKVGKGQARKSGE